MNKCKYIFLVLVLLGCSRNVPPELTADQHLGKTEKEILAQYGMPVSSNQIHIPSMADEIHVPLVGLYEGQTNVVLTQLIFTNASTNLHFWFWLEVRDGQKVVVSDLEVPDDAIF